MFNAKLNENVSCWFCDHFQRYDRSEDPLSCVGECRARNLQNWFFGNFLTQGLNFRTFFPAFNNAQARRCGMFQRTREKNLPAPPPLDQYLDCAQYGDVPAEQQVFQQYPWNKKNLAGYVDSPEKGVMCWNCDHFAVTYPDRPDLTDGECCAKPPDLFYQMYGMGGTGYLQSVFGVIEKGICYWCAQWERARHDVLTRSMKNPCPDRQGEKKKEKNHV